MQYLVALIQKLHIQMGHYVPSALIHRYQVGRSPQNMKNLMISSYIGDRLKLGAGQISLFSQHSLYILYTACLSFDSEILCLHPAIFEYETKHQPTLCAQNCLSIDCQQYYMVHTYTYIRRIYIFLARTRAALRDDVESTRSFSFLYYTGSTYK